MVDSSRLPISDELRKASTDNFVVALEGIGAIVAGKDSALLVSYEESKTWFKKAVLETQDGVGDHYNGHGNGRRHKASCVIGPVRWEADLKQSFECPTP